MRQDNATARFATVAREYCIWAEGEPGAGATEMLIARRHLACLIPFALDLPDTACDVIDPVKISPAAWRFIFKRFGELPVNYYSNCIDPLHASADEASLGDLADDLADIWRDLKGGLDLLDAGNVKAASCVWREGFKRHWGRHATSALYILQCWVQAHEAGGGQALGGAEPGENGVDSGMLTLSTSVDHHARTYP